MNKKRHSYPIGSKSNEYEIVSLVPKAEPITWRDWFSILKGTYLPKLYLEEVFHLTNKGRNREFKRYYIEPIAKEIKSTIPFLTELTKKKPSD